MMTVFGDGLRMIREEKNLTITELARMCDPPINRTYLSKLENGKATAGPDVMHRLSMALNVPYNTLEDLSEQDLKGNVDFYTYLLYRLSQETQKPTNNKTEFYNGLIKENGPDWGEMKLPRYRNDEHYPDKERLNLIKAVLSLEPEEVSYFQQVITLYSTMRDKGSK